MSYYFRADANGLMLGVWQIRGDIAVRIDVTGAENRSPGTYFQAEPGETIWETIRRQASAWFEPDGRCPFHKMNISPGEYYHRMERPTYHQDGVLYSPSVQHNENTIAIGRGQLTALTRHLDRICQTVQPTKEMLGPLRLKQGEVLRSCMFASSAYPAPVLRWRQGPVMS